MKRIETAAAIFILLQRITRHNAEQNNKTDKSKTAFCALNNLKISNEITDPNAAPMRSNAYKLKPCAA